MAPVDCTGCIEIKKCRWANLNPKVRVCYYGCYMVSLLRHYWVALCATLLVFVGVLIKAGPTALWPVFILAIIEITFSFDNAVLNSEVLGRMSKVWRTVFLTVGIAIAVFGVRLLMPLVLVAATTSEGVGKVLDLAINNPELYAEHLHEGYPVIAAFGGIFLLMIGLRFLAEERDAKWLPWIEHNVARHRRPWLIPIAGAGFATLFIATLIKPGDMSVVISAIVGIFVFVLIKGISVMLESSQSNHTTSKSNFINFMYLELLDASFSFDGVIAAFAITKEVLLITAGLGIGALYVRSITVHLLQSNTLATYRYLVHGAHYAIASLGVMMLLTMRIHLPEWLTGLMGITIVGLSVWSSVRHNRQFIERARA